MVKIPPAPKPFSNPNLRDDMASVITELARIQEQMSAHVNLLQRIELQYNERMANNEKLLQENCVTADTALYEARNNTDRIDIMKWVIGGITIVLTSGLGIVLEYLLRK